LDAIFLPKSVAVIGATDRAGSVARTVQLNLMADRSRRIYAINPKRDEVLGMKSYRNVAALPEQVDMAVIITPATTVPGLVRECVDAGIAGLVIISAGFKERGAQGVELERQIKEELKRGKTRVIGPNCLGVMNPRVGLNATFAHTIANPGTVAFISQSGALLTAILDWSLKEVVGFSGFVSTGSMLDVDWGDLIHYYGEDPHTRSILLYIESISDPRSFMSAARQVALTKPVIVIKAGRTEAASKAAASHTGALTGSDEVLDAAFRRCGVLRVDRIADLFYMAEALGKQPRPAGPRLAIVTNAGGPGVLATDALIRTGGELAVLSDKTMAELNAFLPEHWSHNNPVDILGDSDPERFRRAMEVVAADPNTNGILVITAPQGMTEPAQTAQAVTPFAHIGKPVLASWMGGQLIASGETVLNQAGIPTYSFPDTAARVFNYMWQYTYSLRALYETPSLTDEFPADQTHQNEVATMLRQVRNSGRTLLSEAEAKTVLAMYSIPTVPTPVAKSEDEAVRLATKLGYPVVLKLYSETITHKTDVGGVQLNLLNDDGVRIAFR
jgi:acetyltransferase